MKRIIRGILGIAILLTSWFFILTPNAWAGTVVFRETIGTNVGNHWSEWFSDFHYFKTPFTIDQIWDCSYYADRYALGEFQYYGDPTQGDYSWWSNTAYATTGEVKHYVSTSEFYPSVYSRVHMEVQACEETIEVIHWG